ncbi:MAG TPA: hypothetical protein PLX77_06680, partial [Candidatus Cloacimonadota bacterium]|nr:hypothetical protein [Candidatus Cloacimonadota bacterium]
MGLLATATLPLYTRSFSAMSFLINGLSRTDIGYVLFNINSHLIALCIMIPATFMAGMTLPLLTNILLKSGGGEAAIGRIYAANTFGAIVGILSAVNLVMPCFGTKGLLVSGGFVDVGVGAFLLIAFGRISSRLIKYSIPLTAVAASMVFFSLTTFDQAVLSSGVYRLGKPSLPAGARPLYYRDGKTATIALIRHPQGQMSIRTNGKTDALIAPLEMPYGADEITMVMAAVVPLALNPAARNVANIGLGSGLTTHTLLATDSIKIVDTIEIESCMVEGAHGFGKRVARAFYDPRSVIHIDDAKSFFSTHQKHYDIIVSEPSNPWVSGVGSLFSYEFYHYIQSYLNEGGIFVQWLQLYEINLGDVASVIKALDRAFAYYRVYNTDNANILILASKDNQLNTVNTWVFDHPKLSSELSRVAIQGPEDLSIRYLGDKHLIAPFFESLNSPLNSDYFPSLSYNAPKSRFKQDDASDLSWLHIAGVPILSWLNGIEPQGKISREGKYFDFYDRQIDAQLVVGNDVAGLEDQKLRFSAEFVNSALTFCRKPPLSDEVIIDILYTIAAAINPYLSKQQLNQYWMGLIDQYVTEDTNGKIEQWLRFHHAISQRQAALTIEYANRILSTEEELTENL